MGHVVAELHSMDRYFIVVGLGCAKMLDVTWPIQCGLDKVNLYLNQTML